MNKFLIEDSIKTSLKLHVSALIADNEKYYETCRQIDEMDVNCTTSKVVEYLEKNVGVATLQEIEDFLSSSRYQSYLASINKASALIAGDVKSIVQFLVDEKEGVKH